MVNPNANTNVVLVKYDSSGNAQWAYNTNGGASACAYEAIAVDSGGAKIYAAGYAGEDAGSGPGGTFDFGTGAGVTTTATGNNVLVQYH